MANASISLPMLKEKLLDTFHRGQLIESQYDIDGNNLFHLVVDYDLYDDFYSLFIRLLIMSEGMMDINTIKPNHKGIHPIDMIIDNGKTSFLDILRQIYSYIDIWPLRENHILHHSHIPSSSTWTISAISGKLTDACVVRRRRKSRSNSIIGSSDDVDRRNIATSYISSSLYECDQNLSFLFRYKIPTVFDDLFNGTDVRRNNCNEMVLKSLESELSSINQTLRHLHEQKRHNHQQLKSIESRLHNREHELCLQVWESIDQERQHRKEVESISEQIDHCKQEIEDAKSGLRWEGIVEVRQYGGIVLQVWKPMICVIAHRTMTLYPSDYTNPPAMNMAGDHIDEPPDTDEYDDHDMDEESMATSIRDNNSFASDYSRSLQDGRVAFECLAPTIITDKKKRKIKSYSVMDIIGIHLQAEATTYINQSPSTRSMSMSDAGSSNISHLTAAFTASASSSRKYEVGKLRPLSSHASKSINYCEMDITLRGDANINAGLGCELIAGGHHSTSTHVHLRVLNIEQHTLLDNSNDANEQSILSTSTPAKIPSSYSISAATTRASTSSLYPSQNNTPLSTPTLHHSPSSSSSSSYVSICRDCRKKYHPHDLHYQVYHSNHHGFLAALHDLTDDRISLSKPPSSTMNIEIPPSTPTSHTQRHPTCQICHHDIIQQPISSPLADIGDDDGILLESSYHLSRSYNLAQTSSSSMSMKRFPIDLAQTSRTHRNSLPTLVEQPYDREMDHPTSSHIDPQSPRKSDGQMKLSDISSYMISYDDHRDHHQHRATISSMPKSAGMTTPNRHTISKLSPKPLRFDASGHSELHVAPDSLRYIQPTNTCSIPDMKAALIELKKKRSDVIYPQLIQVIESREANLENVRYLQSLRRMVYRFLKHSQPDDDSSSPLSSPTRSHPIPAKQSTTYTIGCSMPPDALIPEFQSTITTLEQQFRIGLDIFKLDERRRDLKTIIVELNDEIQRYHNSTQKFVKPKAKELYDVEL